MLLDWTPPSAPDDGDPEAHEDEAAILPALRLELLAGQDRLESSGRNVLLVLMGDDRPGINHLIDDLHEWLDPRGLEVHTLDEEAALAEGRPPHWRYWRRMPAYGRIGVFYRSWVQDAAEDRMAGRTSGKEFRLAIERCRRLEEDLAQDRSVLLKCYLHLPDKKQDNRFSKARQDPYKHYRIHTPDRLRYEAYRGGRHILDEALRGTHRPGAEWHILDTSDRGRLREVFARHLITALKGAVDRHDPGRIELPPLPDKELLPSIDIGKDLDRKSYHRRLREAQHDLNKLTDQADREGLSSVLVFEGVDAAGKGGAIRRLTRAISAEHYEVVPIGKPTPDELNHHYMWRFWSRLPGPGKMKIFDRSWYGRVMVERIEGFCPRRDWQRAYGEINAFEADLIESGVLVLKFWLHIDQDEQARRFAVRDSDPLKAFKITEEDLRNRAKWGAYRVAIEEMLARTSTGRAPWHLVPANSKHWARVQVAETVRDVLAKVL